MVPNGDGTRQHSSVFNREGRIVALVALISFTVPMLLFNVGKPIGVFAWLASAPQWLEAAVLQCGRRARRFQHRRPARLRAHGATQTAHRRGARQYDAGAVACSMAMPG